MPESNAILEQSMPRTVVPFAPWCWFLRMGPWKRWALAACGLISAYIEFPAFIIPLIHRQGGLPGPIEQLFAVLWYPIDQLIQVSPTIAFSYYWQADLILSIRTWLGI